MRSFDKQFHRSHGPRSGPNVEELRARGEEIADRARHLRKVAPLSPVIALYEEQAQFYFNKADEWSKR